MKKIFLLSLLTMVILTGCGGEEAPNPTLTSEGVEEILVEEIQIEEIMTQ